MSTTTLSERGARLPGGGSVRRRALTDIRDVVEKAPPPPPDAVRQFCDKHRVKIREYIANVCMDFAIPYQCTIEGAVDTQWTLTCVQHSDTHMHARRMYTHFTCQNTSPAGNLWCLFPYDTVGTSGGGHSQMFAFKTRHAHVWLHLMFLHLQVAHVLVTTIMCMHVQAQQVGAALGQDNEQVILLKQCWMHMPTTVRKNRSFSTLVTSAFPSSQVRPSLTHRLNVLVLQDREHLKAELDMQGFYDHFTHVNGRWSCHACAQPDRVNSLFTRSGDTEMPIYDGQLKVKKGK
jgi:hypothetical protein